MRFLKPLFDINELTSVAWGHIVFLTALLLSISVFKPQISFERLNEL